MFAVFHAISLQKSYIYRNMAYARILNPAIGIIGKEAQIDRGGPPSMAEI